MPLFSGGNSIAVPAGGQSRALALNTCGVSVRPLGTAAGDALGNNGGVEDRQARVREDLGDQPGINDGRDALQARAAAWALCDVDMEHAADLMMTARPGRASQQFRCYADAMWRTQREAVA